MKTNSSGTGSVRFFSGLLIVCIGLAPISSAQSEEWYEWDFTCKAFAKDNNAGYRACTKFIVQAPKYGVTEWAGPAVGFFPSDTLDKSVVKYRVTRFRTSASECGSLRTVQWNRVLNRNVNGFGKTAAYYLLSKC